MIRSVVAKRGKVMKTVGGQGPLGRLRYSISPYWTSYRLYWPNEDDIPSTTIATLDRSYVSHESDNSYSCFLAGLLARGLCPLTVDQAEEWFRLYAKHYQEIIVLGTRPVLVLQTGLWHPTVPVWNPSPEATQVSSISIYQIQPNTPIIVGCIQQG